MRAPMPAAAVLAHLCATAGGTLAPLAHLFAEALVARQVAPRKKAQLARRNSLSLNSHCIELSRSCDLVVWCSVGQSQCAVALKETRIYTRQTDRRRRMLHCNTWQLTATRYNTLQHTATHCNTLQHTATHCNTLHQNITCNTTKAGDTFRPGTCSPGGHGYAVNADT